MPMCNSKLSGSVLVVAGDLPKRTRIAELLRSAGHHVHEVNDAGAAQQCLRHPEFNFDVIVSTERFDSLPANVSLIRVGHRPAFHPSVSLCDHRIMGWLDQPFPSSVLLNLIRVAIEHAARARHEKKHE